VKRSIITLVLALATALAATATSSTAYAQAPSQADLDKAKKAFMEGKAFHEGGKYEEAISKYKEAYKLSKKPVLLYNIAIAMEEAQMDDLALMNFRKFLAEADPADPQRPTAETKVKMLEKKLGVGGNTQPTGTNPPDKKPPEVKPPVSVKPAGTYTETDFQHVVVDTAPPGKPLDVTAFVPEDSGFTVTLNYRTAGEGKFSSKLMKWRYKELVARIPAQKMIGSAVQYYLDVKDQAGAPIAKSAKATSPNQVLIEAGATVRFYPDMTDEGDAKVTPKDVVKSDDDDDPLNKKKPKPDDTIPTGPVTPGTGLTDVGSSSFGKAKWGTTIAGGALLGFAALSFVQAKKFGSALEDDSTQCGAPPCRAFTTADDTYAKGVEDTGKRWNTFFKAGVVVGVGVSAVAGYFWYKEMKARKRGEMKVSTSAKAAEASSWIVVPAIGEHTAGATAAVRF